MSEIVKMSENVNVNVDIKPEALEVLKQQIKIKELEMKQKAKEEKEAKRKEKDEKKKEKETIDNDDNDYSKFYGKVHEPFNKLSLFKMIKENKIKESKEYICSYFCKIDNPTIYIYYKWSKEEKSLIQMNKNDLLDSYLTKNLVNENFDAFRWFTVDLFTSFYIKSNIHKETIFIDSDGYNCINMCKGFLHKTKKPYANYSKDIRNKVQIMLDHIKNILCSKDEEQYNYVMKWISNVCRGNKNNSALYLKGPEGIGKSTFTEFIMKYVIGKEISLVLNDTDVLMTSYNSCLMGKLLVVFEELPTFSKAQWEGASSKLKQMITGNELNYSDKYEKKVSDINLNNYIINTNVEAIQHSEGRRYFILDVSSEKMKDNEYFGIIADNCLNNEVGEAFYNFCYSEIDVNGFNPQKMPTTQGKADAVVERLHSVFEFFKNGIHI